MLRTSSDACIYFFRLFWLNISILTAVSILDRFQLGLKRQTYRHSSAAAELTRNRDAAAMRVDNLLRDRETESGAAGLGRCV